LAGAPLILEGTGDIFDGFRPGYEELNLAVDTLRRLRAVAPVVVLRGNHDSAPLFQLLQKLLGDDRLVFVDQARPPESGGILDFPTARGERIVLREKRLSDAPDDFRWRTDVELARYDAARPFAASYEDYLSLYRDELTYPSPYRRTLAVEDDAGRHIGNVMYYNIDAIRREAEIGITIGEREYWSRGYGSDAKRTLCRFGFEMMNLHRIELEVIDGNDRARAIYGRLGFVHEGTRRDAIFKAGRFRDIHVMGLLEGELR